MKNKVIVIGSDHVNTLGVIRCFGENGILPYAIIKSDTDFAATAKSKYIKKSYICKSYDNVLNLLNSEFKDESNKAVIIPVDDKLKSKFILHNINDKQSEIVKYMDKYNQFLLAKKYKLKTAYSKIIDLYSDDIEFDIFPCIIKPLASFNGKKDDITICNDKCEFENALVSFKDKNYKKLLVQEVIDFDYEGEYGNSCFQVKINKNNTRKLINIARKFSYRDVVTLVHEFIHYISYKENNIMEYYLCEFLAIYFETYAINYLIKKGIPKEELDYLQRFRILKRDSDRIYRYEVIFLVYTTFGNLSDTSYTLLKQFYMNMTKDSFEKECKNFYKVLEVIKEEHKFELQDNPKLLGEILSERFIAMDYRYVLGTILAIYAFQYGNMKDVIYLTNHLEEFKDKSLMEACASIGVNLDDPEFTNKAMAAIDKYLNSLGVSKSR